MKAAFYSGASGLRAYQQAMDTVGNNLSNVNTTGYQKETVSFQELIHDEMWANTPKQHLQGHGVRAVSTGISFAQGDPHVTGGDLDFAIVGDGFFAVGDENNDVRYTRDGSFTLSAERGDPYLTTQDGSYVLDRDGDMIRLDTDENGVTNSDDLAQRLGVFQFDNPNGLLPAGGNSYRPGANAGQPRESDEESYNLLRGYLEQSGSDLLGSMTDMMMAQRAFQVSARVVQTADEIEQTVNSLRK